MDLPGMGRVRPRRDGGWYAIHPLAWSFLEAVVSFGTCGCAVTSLRWFQSFRSNGPQSVVSGFAEPPGSRDCQRRDRGT